MPATIFVKRYIITSSGNLHLEGEILLLPERPRPVSVPQTIKSSAEVYILFLGILQRPEMSFSRMPGTARRKSGFLDDQLLSSIGNIFLCCQDRIEYMEMEMQEGIHCSKEAS